MYFAEERRLIKTLREKCACDEYTNDPLKPDFLGLLEVFEKTVKESGQLIRISDLLQKNLNNTNHKLKTANELRSQLIDLAIHELKNPLTLIISYLDIACKKLTLAQPWQGIMTIMFNSARRMNDLITDLLSTERLGEETIQLRLSPVDLIEVLELVITNNQLLLANKHQKLEFHYNREQKYLVQADKLLLSEICSNLLDNAIKYSPLEAEIVITVEKATGEGAQSVIRTSVRDQGPGFSELDKKRMFQKFQRLSADPTGNESSTGLGLYLTKKLVDLHEGRLLLESGQGKGSNFILELHTS